MPGEQSRPLLVLRMARRPWCGDVAAVEWPPSRSKSDHSKIHTDL